MFAFGFSFNPFMTGCCYSFFQPLCSPFFGGFSSFGMFSTPYFGNSIFDYSTPYTQTNNSYMSQDYNSFYTPQPDYYYDTYTSGFGGNYGYYSSLNSIDYDSLFNPDTWQIWDDRIDEKDKSKHNSSKVSNQVKANAKKLGPQFLEKVKALSERLNCNYQDLIAVMISECSLNPAASNDATNATGLIQFMPDTARNLGTTVEKIKKMSADEQLVLVEKYLKDQKETAGFSQDHKLSAGELYALVFLPGRAKREVLCTKGERNDKGKKLNYYENNDGLDTNKDGKITKTELDNRIIAKRVNDSIFS